MGINYNVLSSTEVLTMDSPDWTLTTPLPRAVYGVRGVTVEGRLYLTGKLCWAVCNILKV